MKRYRTQWAAQFYTAAELTRREYLVTFTHGNAPGADLLVKSPNGRQFFIDVKGQASKSFWLIREKPPEEGLFYVLVYLPPNLGDRPEFFIAASAEVMSIIGRSRERTEKSGKRWAESGAGISWREGESFIGKWELLPN